MDKVKFYTHYDRPVCDCEHYEEGTSLTVPDQVEPISVTVARCLRGEVNALSGSKPVYYEYEGNVDVDKAFSEFDETTSPGFDLADVSSLVESAQQADMTASQEAVAEPKGTEQTTEPETQSNGSSTVIQE